MATLGSRGMSGHMVGRRAPTFVVALAVAGALELGGAVGLSYVAGFASVRRVVDEMRWPWLGALAGALLCSFAGYYLAYRAVYAVNGGPRLGHGTMAAVVVGGFGGLLSHAGSALDRYALEAAGLSTHQSRIRAFLLSAMEQGVLALIGVAAGIAVLAERLAHPTPDFSLPWAVIPLPAFGIAFWLAHRYRGRLRDTSGWRGSVGAFVDAVNLNRRLFLRPHADGFAVLGMLTFWLTDACAMWLALAAFGYRMNPAALFVGYATGMVVTRRTAPLGGAGLLMLVLPATISYSGAPFAVSVLAVFLYRMAAFWLPVPFTLAGVPTLRRLGHQTEHPGSAEHKLRPVVDDAAERR